MYNIKFFDTWLASLVLNYRRPHKHGLAGWGEHLKYPKFQFDDWSGFSDEMMTYCVRDVKLNTEVFKILAKELNAVLMSCFCLAKFGLTKAAIPKTKASNSS